MTHAGWAVGLLRINFPISLFNSVFLQNDESPSPGSTLAPPTSDDALDSSVGSDNNGKSSGSNSNAPPPTQINKLKYTGPSHIRKVGVKNFTLVWRTDT